MDEDDSAPARGAAGFRDLDDLSIGELEAYIAELEAEIARVRADIDRKARHRAGVDGLFGRRG